jgi:hypothetical protein
VPPPLTDMLRDQLLGAAFDIMGRPNEAQSVRFMNVFFDVVAPLVKTPRDVVRLVNALKTTWPAVAREVDPADFLAIAALRLNQAGIYRGIRDNPDELCGVQNDRTGHADQIKQHYDNLLRIDQLPEADREPWRRAMRRLFPRLDSVWSNVLHTDDGEWSRERRVCSRRHFPTYFAYSISDDVMSVAELDEFVAHADDELFVTEFIRKNLGRIRRNGSTRVALLLEELTFHATFIDAAKIPSLTATLFALADEIDVPQDEKKAFDIGDNQLRLHWLINRLVHDRFEVGQREDIYRRAMARAALDWACDFAWRCSRPYDPTREEKGQSQVIVGKEASAEFHALALDKLRAAARDGELLTHRRFRSLIFDWYRFSYEGAAEVRRWTDEQLSNDAFIVTMAEAMTGIGWASGIGFDGMADRVARRTTSVYLDSYKDILDVESFEARVRELLDRPIPDSRERDILRTYMDAPRKTRIERSPDKPGDT